MRRTPHSLRDSTALRATVLAAASALWVCPIASAQNRSTLELQTDRQRLSAGYPEQIGAGVRAIVDRGLSVWTLDVAARRAFFDDGVNLAAMNARQLGGGWIGSVGAGSSVGAFFLPRARGEVAIGRKWLRGQQLLTSINGRVIVAKDSHRDRATGIEVVHYGRSIVTQLGSVVNWSSPGNVMSAYHSAAVTIGSADHQTLLLRAGHGREAYQAIAADNVIVNFPSTVVNGAWRRWLGNGWGLSVGAEAYWSSAYDRTGIQAGVMRQLGRRTTGS